MFIKYLEKNMYLQSTHTSYDKNLNINIMIYIFIFRNLKSLISNLLQKIYNNYCIGI